MQEECNLMTCRSKSRATINIAFQVAIVSMDPVSSGFERYSLLTRFIWPKERNFTGRDCYTLSRAYLKYVINLAVM